MADVRARLRGGPEDGREVNIDADAAGRPVPRVSLPARRPAGVAAANAPMLVYERHGTQPDGVWVFRYVGVEFG